MKIAALGLAGVTALAAHNDTGALLLLATVLFGAAFAIDRKR